MHKIQCLSQKDEIPKVYNAQRCRFHLTVNTQENRGLKRKEGRDSERGERGREREWDNAREKETETLKI